MIVRYLAIYISKTLFQDYVYKTNDYIYLWYILLIIIMVTGIGYMWYSFLKIMIYFLFFGNSGING